MVHNYRQGPKWLPGTVAEVKGPLSYVVQLKSGLLWRRYINQLRDGIQGSTEALVNTPPNDTAHTSLDDSVGDTVEVATPSDNTNEPVVTSQLVGDATENGNTAEELIVLLISIMTGCGCSCMLDQFTPLLVCCSILNGEECSIL